MTIVMIIAPMMGMPKMPIGNMLTNFMHMPVPVGWIAHFMIGTVLAAGFVLFLQSKLPGNNIVRGLLFSLIPFFTAQIIVMPMMGAGIFSSLTAVPMMMVMGSLVGHLIYGVTLGAVTK